MAADATARRVLRALGREVEHPSPLGTGLASDAWRVRSGPAWWALRIARDRPGAGATYPMEHAVMAELAVLTQIVVDVGETSGVELELSSSSARTHGGLSCLTLMPG